MTGRNISGKDERKFSDKQHGCGMWRPKVREESRTHEADGVTALSKKVINERNECDERAKNFTNSSRESGNYVKLKNLAFLARI
jgi:hypothetical protein